jgi:hypothetical protein
MELKINEDEYSLFKITYFANKIREIPAKMVKIKFLESLIEIKKIQKELITVSSYSMGSNTNIQPMQKTEFFNIITEDNLNYQKISHQLTIFLMFCELLKHISNIEGQNQKIYNLSSFIRDVYNLFLTNFVRLFKNYLNNLIIEMDDVFSKRTISRDSKNDSFFELLTFFEQIRNLVKKSRLGSLGTLDDTILNKEFLDLFSVYISKSFFKIG